MTASCVFRTRTTFPRQVQHPCAAHPDTLRLYSRAQLFAVYCSGSRAHPRTIGRRCRFFDPRGLPLPDSVEADDPKVGELRDLVTWCEDIVWSSPKRHGAMTGIMKAQIDWTPLSLGSVRPTQGKTLVGLRRLAKLQHGEPAAHPRALDASSDHPETVVGRQGVDRIR